MTDIDFTVIKEKKERNQKQIFITIKIIMKQGTCIVMVYLQYMPMKE